MNKLKIEYILIIGIVLTATATAIAQQEKSKDARITGGINDKDGSKYEGELKDNKPDGKGIYTYSDGCKYEGDFKEGQYYGKGIYTLKYGSRYEGVFEDDKLKGVLYLPDGSKYEGELERTSLGYEGYGGKGYIGYVPHGKGTFITKDGSGLKGQFHHGSPKEHNIAYTEAISPVREEVNYFTVFDIPLNAPYQRVIDAIRKRGMEIRGGINTIYQPSEIEDYKDRLDHLYQHWNIKSDTALKTFDEKFKFYIVKPYIATNPTDSNTYLYLDPTSFCFTSTEGPIIEYPLYEKWFDIYNSQFHIRCLGGAPDATEIGIAGVGFIDVIFTSFNSEVPRSSLIHLYFWKSNATVISNLIKKYGMPKLYYPKPMEQEDKKLKKKQDKTWGIAKPLKTLFPNNSDIIFEPRFGCKLPQLGVYIYLEIRNNILADDYYKDLALYNAFFLGNVTECFLEWDIGDTKILCKTYLDNRIISNAIHQGLSFDDLKFTFSDLYPDSIIYMHFPALQKLSDLYHSFRDESKKHRGEFVDQANRQF